MDSEHLPSFSLEKTVTVVTGPSREIGRNLVGALAAAGPTVALTARSQNKADAIAGGGRASGHAMDVTNVLSINTAFDKIMQQHGRVDVLVANAGLGANHPAIDVTEADWDDIMDVNAKGLFFTPQAAGKVILAQGSGRSVAISSQTSLVGIRDHALCFASKGAVNQLVRMLALE